MQCVKDMKRIFLDLDGPLLDGKEKHYRCYQRILEGFGFPPIDIAEYWEKKRSLVNRRDLLNLSGAAEVYDDFIVQWLSSIESPEMLALDVVQDGAVDCLNWWKEQGLELILVTMRKNKQALEMQLDSLGLRVFLDAVLVCDHAGGGAGKADAARNFLKRKKRQAAAVWVGDTEADWEAARLLGHGVVLLSNGLREESYLRTLEGAVVKPSIASLHDNAFGRLNAD